ncbi:hypothetical protein ASPZODRAFT_102831 [Penicilliopsis zonata CBS 506.65]|uniref:SnoaL-like domain-containing protein n=1 Tax=Penicilliopsis zonata CBS 506.65 TaxID=1073090 RepID=A0A1L9S8K2_9EURO|nr:hypothetical protein ASPZODRAFT_102831 [Penicilliopsis zonata CBS 506.65]OJJ43490.1 hypothetical protein ASPZODRAFT_102831 [Penicilliopsis zonata CBS 506.65]
MTSIQFEPVQLTPRLAIQAPLSRQGHGPGMLIVRSAIAPEQAQKHETLDPDPLQKWAEESYVVAQIEASEDHATIREDIHAAVKALESHEKCSKPGAIGLVVYGPLSIPGLTEAIDTCDEIMAVVSYGALPTTPRKPHLYHLCGAGAKTVGNNGTIYHYPEAASPAFVVPSHRDFLPAAAAVAHTRCLELLKKQLDGPWFDLESIWEEHTRYEFDERSVPATMATMVAEPYVNHIPTMTGGVGRKLLTSFYAKHFIFNNPEDTALELVSRTIGIDRVVDEFITSFTHDMMVDWLLPGVPPTGKKLRIPFMAVVNIRGDRLYHEHITWDQLTVLVQLGLMPEYLPIPYALPQGPPAPPAGKLEYRVPGAGVETALKMVDESSVPSNEMFQFGVREAQ